MRKILCLSLLCCVLYNPTFAQGPKVATSSSIFESIQKLNFLGSVLYMAAHPDDENTRLIAYLSNHIKAETAYLSLTRGDGGQNLIGPEIRELLGVIRTQELLKARSVDGGKQFFSRANDFGYSKHPDETLKIWEEEKVLADAVWTIRNFQPDIIINRFDHRTPGTTHGHHTAASIISTKAFKKAGDKTAYPEQLKYVTTHQPKRLFYNTLSNHSRDDHNNYFPLDVGVFYPIKGKSNTEIAAEARSQHQCQGMGTAATRGSYMEYLEHLDGSLPTNKKDIFSGINTTWSRLEGGEEIGDILSKVEKDFDFSNPSKSLSGLMSAYQLIKSLPDDYWKRLKLKSIEKIILDCAGIYLEATTNDNSFVAGEHLTLNIEATNRSKANVQLITVECTPEVWQSNLDKNLTYNDAFKIEETIALPSTIKNSNPYWLEETAALGMYQVDDPLLIGQPESPQNIGVKFELKIEGETMEVEHQLWFKETDPVIGETYQPVAISPFVFVNTTAPVYIFANDGGQEIEIKLKAGADQVKGSLFPGVAENWKVSPEKIDFELSRKGEERSFTFLLTPPENQESASINPYVMIDDQRFDKAVYEIEYDHIPHQMVVLPATSKVVKLDIDIYGKKVAYVMGAGDKVPESLEQIGYEVDLLNPADLRSATLKNYDALVFGIRAFNTKEKLKFVHNDLMKYVKDGGTVIIQYNTNHRLLTEELGPYPLQLSKDRVTVEEAPITILKPDHDLMSVPNKITKEDFEDWVQERGLYFPDKWDEKYESIISCHDPGETPKESGLLYCKYGDGHYIYTGYSWFRELPAGVPGAFRIFANMISIGKTPRP